MINAFRLTIKIPKHIQFIVKNKEWAYYINLAKVNSNMLEITEKMLHLYKPMCKQ